MLGSFSHRSCYCFCPTIDFDSSHALNELVKFYATKNLVLERVVPLFNQLYTLLETGKDPVIEALLVTVGSIGK